MTTKGILHGGHEFHVCNRTGVTKLKSLYTRYTYLCDSAYLGAVFSFKMYDCNTGILTK